MFQAWRSALRRLLRQDCVDFCTASSFQNPVSSRAAHLPKTFTSWSPPGNRRRNRCSKCRQSFCQCVKQLCTNIPCFYLDHRDSSLYPRWMEFLGSTAPIPANMLAERVGTKTESHGLETWPQPQKYSQSRKSTSMFPWLKTRGCEVTLHLTTYMFQVAEIIGTWDAGQHTHILLNLSHPVSEAFNFFFRKKTCIWSFQLFFRKNLASEAFNCFFEKNLASEAFNWFFDKNLASEAFNFFFEKNLASEAFNCFFEKNPASEAFNCFFEKTLASEAFN